MKTLSSAKTDFDFQHRSSGILMHITSLPGPHGSGDLGSEAHRFVDFLAAARQSWWQMLPIGPPGNAPAFSPYDSPSAFAGSPWLVSLDVLSRSGLLSMRDLRKPSDLSSRRVNYPAIMRFREACLSEAFTCFQRRHGERQRAFRKFYHANADWLDDFALFAALRREANGKPWNEWDDGVRERRPPALRAARKRLAQEISNHCFVQFEFDQQWRALRAHAQRRGIGLIGDLPIFVAQESADVWTHPNLFQLDRRGRPRRVSGYPPDRFNRFGQRWGHPQYEWARHEQTGFSWWVRRFARLFELFDAVRIDHFLGFTRTWSIPAQATTARSGSWVKSPGFKLFATVERKLGRRPMIAEDLGHVTPEDVRLRDSFGLAPMRLFQFGFGAEADAADHLPHNYTKLTAAYTGNHDLNTMFGWFERLRPTQQKRVLMYTGDGDVAPQMSAIRALLASHANAVLLPIQDVLGLSQQARMNIPGTVEGNWRWRLAAIKPSPASRQLQQLTELFGRSSRTGSNHEVRHKRHAENVKKSKRVKGRNQ